MIDTAETGSPLGHALFVASGDVTSSPIRNLGGNGGGRCGGSGGGRCGAGGCGGACGQGRCNN
jgi:hypothetical protein